MKFKYKKLINVAIVLFFTFIIFTLLVRFVDVKQIGPKNSSVGFASLNGWFKNLIKQDSIWYKITQISGILSLLPLPVFGLLGLYQLVTRKSLKKVDQDIILLGVFYVIVLVLYVVFDKFAINYRPVILKKGLEPSYPSSHSMLAVFVMGSTLYQVAKRVKHERLSSLLMLVCTLLLVITVIGRLLSGVHWLTDIIGGVLISACLLCAYIGISVNTGN